MHTKQQLPRFAFECKGLGKLLRHKINAWGSSAANSYANRAIYLSGDPSPKVSFQPPKAKQCCVSNCWITADFPVQRCLLQKWRILRFWIVRQKFWIEIFPNKNKTSKAAAKIYISLSLWHVDENDCEIFKNVIFAEILFRKTRFLVGFLRANWAKRQSRFAGGI